MYTQDKHTFCTIVTESHIGYAKVLHSSIRKFIPQATIHIFISDTDKIPSSIDLGSSEGCYYHLFKEIGTTEVAREIASSYRESFHDAFRWSLKPIFINYLLREKKYSSVIYVDCDIFFFADPSFLFQELDSHNVLLTPHWRSSDPYEDFANFQLLFRGGLYNAGFIGVSQAGTTAMDWWASTCAHTCIKDLNRGFFVDQTHLNLLPIYFDQVKALRHRGCNVANWNQAECERVLQDDGTVLINGKEPIVFIHFTASTIRGILKGDDSNLLHYLLEYEKELERFSIHTINRIRGTIQQGNTRKHKSSQLLSKVFPGTRLRSRLENIFL